MAVVWKWKSQEVRSAGEHMEEREPCALLAGTQIDAAVGEDRADISPNIGNRTTIGPNSLSSGYLSKRIESRDVEICTSMAVAAACPAGPTGGMRRIQGASEKAAIRLVWKTAGSLPPLLSPLPAETQQPPTTAVPMHNRPGCRPPRASCSELAAEGVTWCPEVLLEVPGKAAPWPHLSFLTQMGMCVWPGPPLSSSPSPPSPTPPSDPSVG